MHDSVPAALTRPPRETAPQKPASPRTSLTAAMLGFFVVALDAQVVNVALPSIRHDLGGGLSGLQWVVTGYTLMFSALLLFAGTLADRIGARRAYGIGMALFIAASAACGLGPSLPALVAARLVQGAGAARVTPTSLALIRDAYQDVAQRTRAIAYWAMGGSVAAAAGPVLGGALAQADWRLIFFLNLPAGAAAFTVLARVPASPRRSSRFDWAGQANAMLALGALTYAVIGGGSRGYGSGQILAAFAVAAAASLIFLIAQARGRHPMVPLDLFRSRTISTALAVAFITMAGFYGVVFMQGLYFQQLRGVSAFETGLLFLPMTALVAILNPVAARTAVRFGRLVPIVGGQLVMAAGLVTLVLLPASAPLPLVAVAMIPVGVGGSFTVPPVTALIIDSAPTRLTGTASGVMNTFRQMGGSLGVAVFGAVIAQAGLLRGQHLSYLVTAALLVAAAAASLALSRRAR
jgi:DHA2 family methylenomycin A resistance protein-like MFS transporter